MHDPIREQQAVTSTFRQSRPRHEDGTALVYRARTGKLMAPNSPLAASEWRAYKPDYYWRVDLRKHSAFFTGTLRANVQRLKFHFEVDYQWEVIDAYEVVLQEITDMHAYCEKYLRKRMEAVTRRYPPEDPGGAEVALLDELDAAPLKHGGCVRISDLDISLEPPAEIAREITERETRAIKRATALAAQEDRDDIEDLRQDRAIGRENKRIENMYRLLDEGKYQAFVIELFERSSRAPETINALLQISDNRHRQTLEEVKILTQGTFGAGDEEEFKAVLVKKLQTSDPFSGSGGGLAAAQSLRSIEQRADDDSSSRTAEASE